jgi:divalent metal cation (Fe/Co/Zn/Cd) transporter
VDIVMDGSSTLYSAHDLSQSLQDKLEALPGVERAFVHVDYETDHTPVRCVSFLFFGKSSTSD